MLREFPLSEDAIGLAVNITGGLLAGRRGRIDSLPDDPQSRLVLVELDRSGNNVWIEVEHLEETPNTELYAGRPEVLRVLGGYAEGVMLAAREDRDGEHVIGRTKRGTVALRYDRQTRIYSITTQDGGSWTTRGRAAAIKVELINLFDAREEPEEGQGEGRKAA